MSTRYIHSSKSSWEIADLLQSIFLMELLYPSKSIWISSPWISDISVIDNRSNQFVSIEPSWANRQVTLTEVVAKLVEMDTRIIIGLNDTEHNKSFINTLNSRVGESSNLRIIRRALLHAKGLIGDHYYLGGSMNFTFNGISLNEETVFFVEDPAEVAHNRISFINKWGQIE
ncbi:phospholipase D-like domain-containing protein DpdK [Paenibacillus tyrfis]|uniref:phospholipase D-like domain-containing protein DpdK n=1 Tax=Paenibacillus tyrfis TaxID=1501230 RepID=UPI00068A2C0D|nr:phospholipase D-like domain-containing protein DpdK [Paenibacillus tyrfis]